jgi:hypothetical protein
VIRARAEAQEFSIGGVSAERGGMRARADAPAMLRDTPVYKLDLAAPALDVAALQGHAVLFEVGPGQWDLADRIWGKLVRSNAAAIVIAGSRGRALVESDLFMPEVEPAIPAVNVTTPAIVELCRQLKPGPAGLRVSLRISIASRTEGTARNVVAMLAGSDAALKDTCVVLSAHYDHLGMKPGPAGDRVYNGANDDGSGTVSVLEIAGALASMPARPRRSIVFALFFGEEEGLYGSRFFARHPPCPAAKIVAAVNLEQLGRTDTDRGPMPATLAFIAPSYTTVPDEFASAAADTGVTLPDKPALGDDFFARSDNVSLAEAGIPAHTAAIPAMFADYHAVGDTWQKVDYPNMVRLTRMLALGLIHLADDPEPPHWNSGIPATAEFVAAWRRGHPVQSTAGRP